MLNQKDEQKLIVWPEAIFCDIFNEFVLILEGCCKCGEITEDLLLMFKSA